MKSKTTYYARYRGCHYGPFTKEDVLEIYSAIRGLGWVVVKG